MLTGLANLLASHDLPAVAPTDPLPLLIGWLADAQRSGRYDDANAMTLATATADGAPSARIVLCKAIEDAPPAIVFYTSYESRKGRELEANPRAAAVFHWPHAKRQARIEGVVARVTPEESDAYFRTRPLLSRIGAVASHQSAALGSRTELLEAAMKVAGHAALRGGVERPEHWGGYRLNMTALELWSAHEGRLHDRLRWRRAAAERMPETAGLTRPTWMAERVSP